MQPRTFARPHSKQLSKPASLAVASSHKQHIPHPVPYLARPLAYFGLVNRANHSLPRPLDRKMNALRWGDSSTACTLAEQRTKYFALTFPARTMNTKLRLLPIQSVSTSCPPGFKFPALPPDHKFRRQIEPYVPHNLQGVRQSWQGDSGRLFMLFESMRLHVGSTAVRSRIRRSRGGSGRRSARSWSSSIRASLRSTSPAGCRRGPSGRNPATASGRASPR